MGCDLAGAALGSDFTPGSGWTRAAARGEQVKSEPRTEVKPQTRADAKPEHGAAEGTKRPGAEPAPAAAATELEEGEMPDDAPPDAKRQKSDSKG